MTQFVDVVVPPTPDGWLNVHSDLSIGTGTTITLQNTGGPNSPAFRVATATTAPSSLASFGAKMYPEMNIQLESAPSAGESTFVISMDGRAGRVAVET